MSLKQRQTGERDANLDSNAQLREWGFATSAIRSGHQRTGFAEHCEPIMTTSSFVFANAEEAAARFSEEQSGYIYSRFSNPTVDAFQTRLALLEGGEACVATASGMSAIMAVMLTLLRAGDHVVASKGMFGSTVNLLQKILPKFDITVSWVETEDLEQWHNAVVSNTRIFFLETPTNPLTKIADIAALAEIARQHDIKLVVDNCFCTPALQKPLALGADIVVHSATKFIDGQGRCIGGAIVGPANFLQEQMLSYMRSAGPSMSPFNAWIFLKGLETLELRMQRHCDNAQKLADWLNLQTNVAQVYYPGLATHPQHNLAKQQQSGYGAVISFEVKGGKTDAWRLIDRVKVMSITANLGDTKTTITHPATTTHARLSDNDKIAAGITPGLIRISAGLENSEDIICDLEQAMCGD